VLLPVLRKTIAFLAAIVLAACVIYFSLSGNWRRPGSGTLLHRVEHVAAFGLLALLLLPLGRTRSEKWAIAAAVLALACGLEVLQYFVFHYRLSGDSIEWWDIRDDGVGVLLALLAVRYSKLRITRQQ